MPRLTLTLSMMALLAAAARNPEPVDVLHNQLLDAVPGNLTDEEAESLLEREAAELPPTTQGEPS